MPEDKNGQKQHGYPNIYGIDFNSNCQVDGMASWSTMYAESSGRGKAWIMIPLNVRSLSAYKKCEIVQVPGMTFLPLAASFLYAKGRYTYEVCNILGFLDPLPI